LYWTDVSATMCAVREPLSARRSEHGTTAVSHGKGNSGGARHQRALAVTTIAPATSSRSSLVQVEVREVRPALVRIGGSHAWSPDGRRIAFGQNQNGSAQLVLTNAAGDQPQVIWQSQEKPWARIAPRYLSFSPDGHLFGVDGGYMLAIVDEGGRIVRQSNGVNDHVWAPDGQHLVVDGSEAGTALAVLSLNGRRRELTRGVDIPGSWSSDGRWIAFTRDRATEGGMPDPGPYDVYVIRSSGGKPQRFCPRRRETGSLSRRKADCALAYPPSPLRDLDCPLERHTRCADQATWRPGAGAGALVGERAAALRAREEKRGCANAQPI
jgi:Tol biopolymer transport system component